MAVPVIVDGQHRSEEELFCDLRVPADALPDFLEQASAAVAQRNGIDAGQDDSVAALAEKLGKQVVDELLASTVMNMAAPFGRTAVTDVFTVGMPRFIAHGRLEPGADFTFTASWALLPRAELSSYGPVEITAPAGEVPAEAVDAGIRQLLERGAQFVKSGEGGPVRAGDVIDLSMETTLHGKPVEGLCFPTRVYTTGAGNMPEGFENQVIGMEPGQTKAFDYEGIAEVGADGAPVMDTYHSTVTVRSKLERRVPELSDEWVAGNVEGCATVAELRERVAAELGPQADEERRHYLNYLAASELAKRFDGHIPDPAYEAVREQLQSELDAQAQAAGMSTEEFLRQQGMNEQQSGVRMILEAHDRLAQSIALDAMARHLGFTVDDADLEEFYRVQAPRGQERSYRRQVEGSGHGYLAREGALRLKTSDYLVAHATIHEGSPYGRDGA